MKSLFLAAIASLMVSCGPIDRLYNNQVVPTTNYIPVQVLSTNDATGEIYATTVNKPVYGERIVYAIKPEVEKYKNTAVGFLPPPWDLVATTVFGLAIAGLTAWKNRDKKKSDRVVSTLVEDIDRAKVVIEEKVSVEAKDAYVKDIAAHQDVRDVRDEIKEHLS